MKNRYAEGFLAGCLGTIILVAIMYVLKLAGLGDPAFVSIYNEVFITRPAPPGDHIISAFLFILAGGAWGVLLSLLIKHPTILKGFLFGLLPTLWMWIAVNAYMGKPLFNGFTLKGLVLPIVFNMVIWGSFVGWFMSKRKHADPALYAR